MKTSLIRACSFAAVIVPLIITVCSNSPTSNDDQYNGTTNGNFTVTRPAASDSVAQGGYVPVAWTTLSSITDTTVIVSLYKGSTLVSSISHRNTGADTIQIPYTGSGYDYRVRISAASDTSKWDMSSIFRVYSGYYGTITVTSPTRDSSWVRGSSHYLYWTYTGTIGPVNIQLYNDTTLVTTYATGVSNSGSYYLTIPSGLGSGNQYRFKITSYYDVSLYGYSDNFAVTTGYWGTYLVTSPTFDSAWTRGVSHYVQWTYSGSPGANVNIYLYLDTTLVSTLATGTSNSGSYYAGISSSLGSSNRYRIKIISYYDTSIYSYSANFSITSGYLGTYAVTSPTVDSTWNRGAYHPVMWNYTGSPGAYTTIRLYNGTTLVSTLATTATTSAGSYSALIPASVATGTQYRIVVSSYYDASITDTSDYFTIVSGYTGSINITSPTSDSSWNMGASHYVRWTTTGSPGAYVNIYLYNNTALISTIASSASNTGSYYAPIPTGIPSGTQYRIVVSGYYDPTINDTSDYFTVTSQYNGTYTVTSPPLDTIWSMGASYYVRWNYTGNPGTYTTVRLYNNTTLVTTLASTATTANGYYYAAIPTGIASGTQYRIVVSSYYDPAIADTSDFFNITSGYSGSYVISSPPLDTIWNMGGSYYVRWNYTGNPGTYTTVLLYNNTTLVSTLATTATTSNNYYYATIPTGIASGSQYRIVVSSYYDPGIADTSDFFNITSGYSGSYTVTSPPLDTTWSMGGSYYVRWTYTGNPGTYTTVRLYNNTTLVSTLATTATTSNNYYYATIPTGIASGIQYRIVVSSYYDPSIADTSEFFTVTSSYSGSYSIMGPNSGSIAYGGYYYSVLWTYTGNPGSSTAVRLYNDTTLVATLISSTTTSNGYYTASISTSYPAGTQYRIVVSSYYDQSIADTSEYFTIVQGGYTTDSYEPDASAATAKSITTDGVTQCHTLMAGESDWMVFSAVAGISYSIETFTANVDTYLYLYSTDGSTLITSDDDDGRIGASSLITWTCTSSGNYYVRVAGFSTAGTGPYDISITTY
jgi:hypothetical protein